MRHAYRLVLWFLLLGAMALTVVPRPQADEKPDGAALFRSKCSMCHGLDGKGFAAIKSPDFTDPKVQTAITDKEMITIIKEGKKGTAMQPFADKLKDNEIEALVKFIRSLNSKKNGKEK